MPLARSRRWTPVVVAVLIAGSACGESDEGGSDEAAQTPAVEAWVDGLCSSVGDWQHAMADARTALSDPQEVSVADLRDVLDEVDHATRTLVADLKATPVPDTESGEQVQGQLSSLGNQLQDHAQVVEDAVDRGSGSGQELLEQVSTVTGALSGMAADTKAAFANIREAAGAADLGDAIASSPSCQDLDLGVR